jgi:NAD(P)-dependent dehydrogenase (short-subunit alcohol dehydrogenase family)
MARLAGKRVLVTGAGSGIGRATARTLAAEGATAIVADIDLTAAQASARAAGGEAHRLDVADQDSWTQLLAAAGEVHGLVNCAGVDAPADNVEECSPADWERVMRINLDGVFLGTKAAAAVMSRAGAGGSIVNFSSVLAIVGDGETISYGASKAAVGGLTRSAALALAPAGIRVNSIHPGYIRTPMTERWLARPEDSGEAGLAALHPLGRIGEPEDVANLVIYLLCDESSYVTGAQLAVDGGYLAV